MDITLFIIVVIVLIHQNNKIRKLESLLKDKDPAQTSAAPGSISAQAKGQAQYERTILGPVPVAPGQGSSGLPTVTLPTHAPAPTPVKQSEASSEEMSGRILGRIGIGALVIGVSFFIKYAFDNNWIVPVGRVMVGILIGIVLLGIGQWLRKKYLSYSDLLMGGGLAVLYISVYASYALYGLTDPITAFLALAVITAIGVIISIMNATQTLAIVAAAGGYLAPALIGAALVGPTVTFTYLTILNVGILGVLVYKKWAPLVLLGLIGTWLHFGTWLAISYTKDLLIPTLFFILIQFLIFTAASVYRLIAEKRKAEEADYALLALTALTFAGACCSLLYTDYKDFLSLGFALTAVFYGAIALVAYKENPSDRSLNIFLPGLSVAFLTAAIPIEFSGSWIAAWWFVESLVLYVVASKSSSRGYQVMGLIVYILGLLKLFAYTVSYQDPPGYVVIFNGPCMMVLMAIAIAYAIAFVYRRYGSLSGEIQKRGITAFIIIANALTVYVLTSQIASYYQLQIQVLGAGDSIGLVNASNTAVSIAWALYAVLLTIVGFAKKIPTARLMSVTLFILTACKVIVDVWDLGQLYRVVSFIAFGVIALVASFMYVKYKDRLKHGA